MKKPNVQINNVINPTKIESMQSNKFKEIWWKAVNPITKASILTDIPSSRHVLFFIKISFSFSLNPSIIIKIPTIPIIIPPAIQGIFVI